MTSEACDWCREKKAKVRPLVRFVLKRTNIALKFLASTELPILLNLRREVKANIVQCSVAARLDAPIAKIEQSNVPTNSTTPNAKSLRERRTKI